MKIYILITLFLCLWQNFSAGMTIIKARPKLDTILGVAVFFVVILIALAYQICLL